MFQVKSVALIVLGSALAAVPVFGQEGYLSEVSVQYLGSFDRETTKDGVKQSASKSGGVLGSCRYFFSKHHGIELGYGDTINTQRYGLSSGNGGMSTHSRELTAAYVFRVPLRRWSVFGLAGAADLVFQPRDAPKPQNQPRAAFVYGGGVDVDITERMFFRAQYRGWSTTRPPGRFRPLLAWIESLTAPNRRLALDFGSRSVAA